MLRTCFLYPYEVNSNKTWLPFQGLWLHKACYYRDIPNATHFILYSRLDTEWCCCLASSGLSIHIHTPRSATPPSWDSLVSLLLCRLLPFMKSDLRQTCLSPGFLLTSKLPTVKQSKAEKIKCFRFMKIT